MPFYEYECTACKFYVEALQKISEAPLRKCPSCKKQTLKRLVSAPVFRLKGGGWYETDFKSDGEQKRNIHGREEPAEAATQEPKDSKADATDKKPAEPTPAEGKSAPSQPESKKKKTVVAKPAARAKPSKPKARAKQAHRKKARRR